MKLNSKAMKKLFFTTNAGSKEWSKHLLIMEIGMKIF